MDKQIVKDTKLLYKMSYHMATSLLKQFQEFHPLTAFIDKEGKSSYLNIFEGNEFPNSKKLVQKYTKFYKKESKKYRAVSIIYNTTVKEPSGKAKDTVIISIHHKGGYSKVFHVPYKIISKNKIHFYKTESAEQKSYIFS
ncbi:hypothetical protein HYX02_02200 [Candidatus Woesearchaeota archaeon]|nr:hypothetical protein [Candidatus Woesearchaeota archaeon]